MFLFPFIISFPFFPFVLFSFLFPFLFPFLLSIPSKRHFSAEEAQETGIPSRYPVNPQNESIEDLRLQAKETERLIRVSVGRDNVAQLPALDISAAYDGFSVPLTYQPFVSSADAAAQPVSVSTPVSSPPLPFASLGAATQNAQRPPQPPAGSFVPAAMMPPPPFTAAPMYPPFAEAPQPGFFTVGYPPQFTGMYPPPYTQGPY